MTQQQEFEIYQKLHQKYNQVQAVQTIQQTTDKPKKKGKKKPQQSKIVRPSDAKLGFWVLCLIVFVITANFIYNEFKTEPKAAQVINSSRKK